jgi:hypothetical protein
MYVHYAAPMTKNDRADNRVINITLCQNTHLCKQVCKHFLYMQAHQQCQIGDILTCLLHKSDCTLANSSWKCSHRIFM